MKNIKFFQETQKATNPNFVKKGKLLNMKILKNVLKKIEFIEY